MPDNLMKDKVLGLVRLKGPVTPTNITQEMGISTIISSALLSELVSNKQVKISNVKMGGTPLYYAPGQEEKLQEYTKYLHAKEKEAYDRIKAESVLRDSFLEPVTRVAMRNIKDFAVPLQVQSGSGNELFWKWYLMENEDAEPKIKKILGIEEKPPEKPAEKAPKPAIKEKQKTLQPATKTPGAFVQKIRDYFSSNQIELVEEFPSKRKTEAEFIISVPSPVGSVRYYCRAKDKKTCNEGDLSTAYVVGESNKLPVFFVTTGKLTKKATEMLEKEFRNINVKQM